MNKRRISLLFITILAFALLGTVYLILNSRASNLRVEIDELRGEVAIQEELFGNLMERWRLATAPGELERLAARRLELVVPEEIETITVY